MELCRDDHSKLERGRQQIFDRYGSDPNVSGVGIGFRRAGNAWTDKPAVVVLVAKKRPAALIPRHRLLPRTVEIDGTTYEVDVVQAGPFSTGAGTAVAPPRRSAVAPIDERMRPPRQGASISNPADGRTAGTLGLFVIDNTDDKICLLTCNHVIARMGRGRVGDPIVQPGYYDNGTAADAIATLKRWAPTPASGTKVDGAIAQLTDQSAYTLAVARDLMAPISATHLALGMVAAGDLFGSCLLTRMDETVSALNIRLPVTGAGGPCAGPAPGLADPQPGMKIEKVGRTTGYTSSEIIAIGVQAEVITPVGVVVYQDLIFTFFFSLPGDSGSVVFAGGDGKTLVPPPLLLPCGVLNAVSNYYEIPLNNDNDLADQVRDDFFMLSETGKFMVSLTYANSQSVIDRLEGQTATADEISYAQEYYAKYRDFMAGVLADPNSTATVTQEHLDDALFIIDGLNRTILTSGEGSLAYNLYDGSLVPTLGMNRQEVLAYMNNPALHMQVYNEVLNVPEIHTSGEFKPQPPEPTS